MKIFLSERKKKVTSWSSNSPLEILLMQKEILLLSSSDTTFGLSILYKVVFCVYKLDFSKKMLEKGGIFEGSSCVFGRKSIIVIVQSWFFRVQIKFNLFHIDIGIL